MWAAAYLFVIFSMTTYFVKKMRSPESSTFKYYFTFGIFYLITLLIAGVLWPLFLLRPKDVRNSKNFSSKKHNIVQFYFRFITIYGIASIVAAVIWPVFLLRPRDVRNAKNLTRKEHNPVRFYYRFITFYVISSIVAAVIWPFFLLRPRDVRNATIGTRIIKHIVNRVSDIKWILRDGHHLSEDRGAVIVSNHQLTLDILGMFTIWDHVGKIAAIAKKQLLYVFPFGLTAYLAGVVFIDRNNPKTAYKQLQETSDLMVKNKTKIWLFPEGTRNKDYRKLLPFKKGAFSIAVAAQVPIIPVVYSPYYFVNAQKYIFGKGHIIIQALEPIPTVGLTNEDIPDLIAKVHEKMSAVYKELSKEVLNDLPANYPYTNVG